MDSPPVMLPILLAWHSLSGFFSVNDGSLWMGWALLTCYSRIYLGVHYPGDLIAGTLVGLIAAYIVYRLFLKVSGYKTMKKVPHIYAPILVGGLTIVGILIYSTVMILQAQN